MKTVIFLHGFFASGNCEPANALKEALVSKYRVVTPDLPMHPKEALMFIRSLCDKEEPDLLIGNSCGSFYAQILAPIVGVPALLGNPYFKMTEFLQTRIGVHQYKSQRQDGIQEFTIDEQLISEFEEIEKIQFNYTNPYYKDKIWGIFGENDTLANFEQVFSEHYNNVYHFPGAHTPTATEVKTWYVPLVEKMLILYCKNPDGCRYFQHFKGGKYKYIHSAFDSETKERLVVYKALYDEEFYWVRPEQMFFEKVEKDGKIFNRFVEKDSF
ncbi:MAG: DUF1653 domain-containing protein [Bacteroidaceae bacterium]|nr:DUF1653 domain-containing protein [Bacteroidaceae bacterium]